jgi:hypothetical protein
MTKFLLLYAFEPDNWYKNKIILDIKKIIVKLINIDFKYFQKWKKVKNHIMI